ncbi:MAG TPA: hypothetical protein VEP90_14565, partial [Methylomirabilota bacterium]|nr:hypothetical protein [Methylomirabilota bacterium]
ILGAGSYYAYTKIKGKDGRTHWKRRHIHSNGPKGHAYGFYGRVPRGHAYGHHRNHNWDNHDNWNNNHDWNNHDN